MQNIISTLPRIWRETNNTNYESIKIVYSQGQLKRFSSKGQNVSQNHCL